MRPAAMLSCAVLAMLVGSVWSDQCTAHLSMTTYERHNQCNYCSYSVEGAAEPQLLWATTNSALLRARVCGCWCRNQTYWFYRNVTMVNEREFSLHTDEKLLNSCSNKDYCEIYGSTRSNVMVYVAFYNYNTNTTMLGKGTYVRFCPAAAPRLPENVSCRKHGDTRQLRWTYNLQYSECHSYLQFVVNTDHKIHPRWYWLGEVSPLAAAGGEPFGGLVRRCPDDPHFLCADLINQYQAHQVQLGVRRIDSDDYNAQQATDWITCSEYLDPPRGPVPGPPPLVTAHPAVPAVAGRQQPPPPAATSAPGGRQRHHHPCGSSSTLLVALVALTVCVFLLPLAFYAGRRSRDRKQLDVSWQQLREDRADLHTLNGSATTVCGERLAPPQYEYDYACGTLPPPQRSPLPPPLPALPPPPAPPPRAQSCAEERNYMYAEPLK